MPGIKDFRDKVVTITGAGSGIGRATSEAFAAEGAKVVLADIDGDAVGEVAKGIRAKGGTCFTQVVDVADRSQVEALAKYTVSECGRVDIIYNNAGVGIGGSNTLDSPLEDWEWLIGINLWGVIYGFHYFLPYMIEQRSGHVVSTASMAGLTVAPGLAAYSATKFGVVGMSEAFRVEMKQHNVGVTTICPGLISTNIANASRFIAREDDPRTPEAVAKLMADRGHPPEKVARAVLNGIRKNKPIVPVGIEAWIGWWAMRLSPRLAEAFMGYMMNRAV